MRKFKRDPQISDFKAAKEAQEIQNHHAVSLSADRVVPQVFRFYCTEFFILHTMAET